MIAPYDTYPIMPSLNDKNNIAAAPDAQVSEIITPLDVHAAHKTESRLMGRWAIPMAMTLVLLSIVSAGGWFLHYLSSRPFDAGEPPEDKAALSESSTPEAGPIGKDNLVHPPGLTGGATPTPTNPTPTNERQDHPGRKKAVAPMATGREHESRNDLRINALNQNGQAAEQVGNWQAADEHYTNTLKLDPENEFAKQGKERALKHIRIFEQIQSFLNRPQTLTTSNNLEKADTLLREAQNLEPKGTDFTRSLEQLERMVVAARKPVRLTITSDNQTQVDVYRIGRLGQFSQKELDLKPGIYTVVGYRDGYQDVRQQVVIDPGQENLRVTIICKVKV